MGGGQNLCLYVLGGACLGGKENTCTKSKKISWDEKVVDVFLQTRLKGRSGKGAIRV